MPSEDATRLPTSQGTGSGSPESTGRRARCAIVAVAGAKASSFLQPDESVI